MKATVKSFSEERASEGVEVCVHPRHHLFYIARDIMVESLFISHFPKAKVPNKSSSNGCYGPELNQPEPTCTAKEAVRNTVTPNQHKCIWNICETYRCFHGTLRDGAVTSWAK